MSTAPPLHPLGTARVRFLVSREAPPDAPAVHLPPPRTAVTFAPPVLVQRLRDLDADDALAAAAELAALPGVLPADRDAVLWLAAALFVARADGGTFLPLHGDDPDALPARLDRLGATRAQADAVLAFVAKAGSSPLIGTLDDQRPLVRTGDALALHADAAAERRLALALARRRATPSTLDAPTRAAAVAHARAAAARTGRSLDDDQAAAVALALEGTLTAVSGGPGTGKTTIVISLLRALVHAGADPAALLLAAPTGKAAHRMAESVRQQLAPGDPVDARLLAALPDPATLHRLLGFSPASGRFRHHAGNPLAARAVLVDEASMVDLPLADHLLRALAPSTALVLLGDAQQLPSVAAGAVLRDLVVAAAPPGTRAGVAKLTKSHRMRPEDPHGSHVLSFAAAVNAGDLAALASPASPAAPAPRAAAQDVAFLGVERLDASRRRDLQARWFQRLRPPALAPLWERTWEVVDGRIADAAALAPLLHAAERGKVLCALRDAAGGSGMADWNAALRDRLGALLGVRRPDGFLPGEPAIATRNDYDRGLFNGDLGLVVDTAGDARPPAPAFVVERPDGLRAYPLDAVRTALEPAWALTIHRAQGSEFDEVVLALPSVDTPVWTRELLYTAATRARRGVLLVGAPDRLAAAAAAPALRRTGLRAALEAPAR